MSFHEFYQVKRKSTHGHAPAVEACITHSTNARTHTALHTQGILAGGLAAHWDMPDMRKPSTADGGRASPRPVSGAF